MAKFELKIKAREMRSKGESVKVIASTLGVTKSTVSLWVRDIVLTVDQLEKLIQRKVVGGELGRTRGAFIQKKRRLDMMKQRENDGIEKLKGLTEREFFVAGIALYWGEGTKKKRGFYICNSDPKIIKFIIVWLKKFFGIGVDRLAAVVGINEIHRVREEVVKKFWSDQTGIPLNHFRKTSFKKAKVHKVYANFNEHYGTLNISVLKGSDIYYKMLGLLTGLSEAARKFEGILPG
jgi:hypothetical protein